MNDSIENVIKINNLSKRYRIGTKIEKSDTLFGSFINFFLSPMTNFKKLYSLSNFDNSKDSDIIYALNDISFNVQKGDVLGVVGPNGAGKSTLLKLLSRITEPSSGSVEIHGRVASLLEVGTGFHPELTGRENVYLNGTILGMTKAEIDKNFNDIVQFSGVEKFIDTPVKRYSSGMKVRLAFSVAAFLEPEILLIDEVLAVGDIDFQKKCLNKMNDLSNSGRTIFFVSHNMAAISSLCNKGVLIKKGKLIHQGSIEDVISKYLNDDIVSNKNDLLNVVGREGTNNLQFSSFSILDKNENLINDVQSGQKIKISISYQIKDNIELKGVYFCLNFYSNNGQILFQCKSSLINNKFSIKNKMGNISCMIEKFPLTPGKYFVSIWAKADGIMLDHLRNNIQINVIGGDFFNSGKLPAEGVHCTLIDHKWELKDI